MPFLYTFFCKQRKPTTTNKQTKNLKLTQLTITLKEHVNTLNTKFGLELEHQICSDVFKTYICSVYETQRAMYLFFEACTAQYSNVQNEQSQIMSLQGQ